MQCIHLFSRFVLTLHDHTMYGFICSPIRLSMSVALKMIIRILTIEITLSLYCCFPFFTIRTTDCTHSSRLECILSSIAFGFCCAVVCRPLFSGANKNAYHLRIRIPVGKGLGIRLCVRDFCSHYIQRTIAYLHGQVEKGEIP